MATMGIVERGGEARSTCVSVPDGAGRGLPTWDADKMNFGSANEGAWGTTIFWKQVGHSICPPLVVESAVMCWPHTGQANLNSLIGLDVDDSIPNHRGQCFFAPDSRRDF